MATYLRDAVKTLLEADDTLMAILTGGIYDRGEISRTETPDAWDADRGTLKPCAVLTMGTVSPRAPFDDAATAFLQIYFYEKSGYDNIEDAMDRVYTLLHIQQVTIDPGFVYEIRHANDLGDSKDDALDCSMSFSRYYAVLMRR